MNIIHKNANIINNVILQMNIIQENANITDQCLTNTQFLYFYVMRDKLADICLFKAVIATAHYPNMSIMCVFHIVLDIDGIIYDPSFCYNAHTNITYFTEYDTFISSTFGEGCILNGSIVNKQYTTKKSINKFKSMCKIANYRNKNPTRIKNVEDLLYTHYVNNVYFFDLENIN